MSKVSRSIAIDAPVEKVFEVISDFESYPDFLPEVQDAAILNQKGKSGKEGGKPAPKEVIVSFTFQMIKTVELTLRFKLTPPTGITWTLVEGDMMKHNNGSWKLKKMSPRKTKAFYTADVGFGLFVPSSIGSMLVEKNLPGMLENFKKRIEA